MAFQNSITTVQYNNPLDNALSAVYKECIMKTACQTLDGIFS